MLQAGSYHTQPGGIWFGPLPAPPHPHPVPGQSRAAASASLHFGVCSGGGMLGISSPLPVPCSLRPVLPHAYSLEGLGAALPAAPLQPGTWRGCLPGFHLSLVFFLSLHPSLLARAHHSWHHLPPPPVGANFTSNPAIVGSPSLLCRLGLGPKMGVWGGVGMWASGACWLLICMSGMGMFSKPVG